MKRDDAPLLSRRFLKLLLGVSIATNIVLLARMNYPHAWTRLALALHPVPAVTPTDRSSGRPDADITVIEYADFQCPFCAAMHEAMQDIVAEGNVRWVYRHYPLHEIHPRALSAAEAAECAGDQGRFWEFSAALYRRQAELDTLPFDSIAAAAGVSGAALRQCMVSGKYREVVIGQLRDGERMKLTGTPTWFINGKRYEGFRSPADLRAALFD
jgi:protein-disulfide isomerase